MSIVGLISILKRYPLGAEVEVVCQDAFGSVDAYNLRQTEQILVNSPYAYEDNGKWFVKGWMI